MLWSIRPWPKLPRRNPGHMVHHCAKSPSKHPLENTQALRNSQAAASKWLARQDRPTSRAFAIFPPTLRWVGYILRYSLSIRSFAFISQYLSFQLSRCRKETVICWQQKYCKSMPEDGDQGNVWLSTACWSCAPSGSGHIPPWTLTRGLLG